MSERKKHNERYDLEDRTLSFARAVRNFVRKQKRSVANHEYARQVIRSSASVGANYIEANEALSKKDFVHRIRICRKEVRESVYWMLLFEQNDNEETKQLIREARELLYIFNAIIKKATNK